MEKIENPFIVTGEIPDKLFCDREKESEWLISSVVNGNNVVLISPRRMGKTSLIEHCFRKTQIKDKYHTFYIDLLPTTSMSEMVYLLSKSIYDKLVPLGKRMIDKFLASVVSIKGSLGYDAISGLPTFVVSNGAIPDPVLTLDEIFAYLASADKPCIVTFDEFQQVSKYPEKNVEALLRSRIQKLRNCNFIYAGSERHMMIQMFQDESRPFYSSATMIDLRAIPQQVYVDFIMRNFKDYNKTIPEENARYIYQLLESNTFYIQRLCNACFYATSNNGICDKYLIEKALDQQLEINASYFKERLSLISAKHKPLLYAVAREGECSSILSADFINKNGLVSASSVQNASKRLIDDGMLTLIEGVYSLTDKFLRIWIKKNLL